MSTSNRKRTFPLLDEVISLSGLLEIEINELANRPFGSAQNAISSVYKPSLGIVILNVVPSVVMDVTEIFPACARTIS